MRALEILGDAARVVLPARGSFDLGTNESVVDAIIGIITRHPMLQEELERTLEQWAPDRVAEVLAALETSGRAQMVERHGVFFWSAAQAAFPEATSSAQINSLNHGCTGKNNQEKGSIDS